MPIRVPQVGIQTFSANCYQAQFEQRFLPFVGEHTLRPSSIKEPSVVPPRAATLRASRSTESAISIVVFMMSNSIVRTFGEQYR
jgi:hypothetical protein